MAFTLPPLPYAKDALAPHMSAETLEFHHEKHHQSYVTNLNGLVEGTPEANMDLMDLIRHSHGKPEKIGIFNNAAQIWNHSFYWDSMSPQGGGSPKGKLAEFITRDFGSYEQFKDAFVKTGATQFGSGYAWLVLDAAGHLALQKTANADLPLQEGVTPLMTCDVWEHAYYIDHRNRRPDFLKGFLDHLANWDFAAANLQAAL
ncbi:superoxide dismutase [Alphaproteobacteria bacterium]|nr:superoxide dismutase [Alphaproteobacteria bacterium]MDC0344796.1 superoxide dismutase [Alphaproteobacteria bacterium]